MEDKNNINDDNEEKASGMAYGIGLGMLFGVAVGFATDDLATWISIGTCFGVAIGSFAGRGESDDKTNHKKTGTRGPVSKH